MLSAYQRDERNSWEMERRWKLLWFIWSKEHFFKPQKKNQWVPINSSHPLELKPISLMHQFQCKTFRLTGKETGKEAGCFSWLCNDTVILWGIREADSSSSTKIESWGEEVTGQIPPISLERKWSCRGSHEISETYLLEYQIKIRNFNKPPIQRTSKYEGDKERLIWGM